PCSGRWPRWPRWAGACSGWRARRSTTCPGSPCCCHCTRHWPWRWAAAAPRPEPAGLPAALAPAQDAGMDTAPACVIACAWYAPDGRRQDLPIEHLSEALAENRPGFAWIGLSEPPAQVLETLRQELGLHELAIEDAMNAHQRPKLEAYGDVLFVVAHTAQMVDGKIRYGETHLFLGPRFLLTIRHGASLSYAAVRTRLEREPHLLRQGPAMALYAVLDFIVDNYAPIVD